MKKSRMCIHLSIFEHIQKSKALHVNENQSAGAVKFHLETIAHNELLDRLVIN